MFGHLDLAIICFATPECYHTLTEMNITEWEKMVEANITSFFVGSRVLLPVMKEKHAMYITVSHAKNDTKKPGSALVNVVLQMQKK